MKFKIYGAYSWNYEIRNEKTKNTKTPLAMNAIKERLQERVDGLFPEGAVIVQYNRLRATAGSNVLDGIKNRLETADALIFDITEFNPNVMFELGLALGLAKCNDKHTVFIIMEGESFDCTKIPSDLLGYFISFYTVNKNTVKFKDTNSLVMRLLSNLSDKYDFQLIEEEEDKK
jgi:hypothetical protein